MMEMRQYNMITSLGFHTFTIFLRLTYSQALSLYKDFQRCKEVRIRPIGKNEKNPSAFPKGYMVEYISKSKGITWYIRFSEGISQYMQPSLDSNNPRYQKEATPYSVRATINPKILIKIRDYLAAANSDCLVDVEKRFNEEAVKISPILSTFESYSMNRIDYCLNIDLVELNIGCSAEQMMLLIKRGDIPRHFTEWTEYNEKSHRYEPNKDALYLQNESITINCYMKYKQLLVKYPDCPDLFASRNLIRFEVQCKYSKVYSLAKENRYNSRVYKSMSDDEIWENLLHGRLIMNPIDVLLDDSVAFNVVRKYFGQIIGEGDYYSLKIARKKIDSMNSHKKVKDRLSDALNLVNRCRSISKARALLQEKDLEVFKRSLKELSGMNINPVTIPREWKIAYIPNLFNTYLNKIAIEKFKEQALNEYIKDCKKQGKVWWK